MRYDITAAKLKQDGTRPLHAGDDYNYSFTLYDSAGNPLDLTDVTIWFTIKRSQTDADASALLQLTSSDGIAIDTAPETGKFVVRFAAADTATLRGMWWYDLQVKGTIDGESGKVVTPLWGQIEFGPNITQATAVAP